jgi:hypothetical protein
MQVTVGQEDRDSLSDAKTPAAGLEGDRETGTVRIAGSRGVALRDKEVLNGLPGQTDY